MEQMRTAFSDEYDNKLSRDKNGLVEKSIVLPDQEPDQGHRTKDSDQDQDLKNKLRPAEIGSENLLPRRSSRLIIPTS